MEEIGIANWNKK